jgi:DNA polymerase-3 subunit alpha
LIHESHHTQGFVHLRVRSAYSLLEGAIKTGRIGELAAGAGTPAVALTDRANLFGALEFSVLTSAAGVQPIIGCALPVTGIGAPLPEKWARTPSLVLLVQNETGWLNLMALSSAAFLDSDGHEEPSVSWAQVCARAEGLILLSGGPDGPVDHLLAGGHAGDGHAALAEMKRVFGGRFYVELQRHGLAREAAAEPALVHWAYDEDVPLVATNDACFETPDMHEAHDALLCISDQTFVGEADRRKASAEHWFKPAAAMRTLFADLPEACDNTIEIARRCAFMLEKHDPILPRFDTGEGRTEQEELAYQARQGLHGRLDTLTLAGQDLAASPEAYREQLDFELNVISQMGFSGYFLIVSDFIKWAKDQGIPVGPGRGSGASSLVAWSLMITDLDPLRYGLLFERFLNPERVSMPDFDIDFCQVRREEVIAYVQDKYGRDRVAQIITFGTLQARAVLRDVGRVMQLPLGMVDRLAKMVPNNPANPTTLAKAIEIEPRLKQARDEDASVAHLLEVALRLEGLYRNASTHAAGIVIGDRPLTELAPLYKDPRSELPATQFNMKWVESAGLVKFDFLGLKTLTVLERAGRFLRQRGAGVELELLPLDNQPAYDLMASGQTLGVFQLESQGMRDILRQLRPGSIEEVTALISLYRPGPMESIPEYIDCKMGRKPIDTVHPLIEPVLKDTYGVIVYQEQVMQIAQILAGYSLGEADLLRRAMGKKNKKEMDKQRARFLSGAAERGVDKPIATLLFERMEKFAGYGFNKGHAAPYAMISYQTAWMKANAPVEFYAASMSLDISNTDKLAVFYQDAKRLGVPIVPPDINRSGADFEVEDGQVLYALGAIRNVGLEAMRHVIAVREAGGAFCDIFDFAERIDPRFVNKRAIENLARAGAFDQIHPGRAQIVQSADLLMAYAQSVAADRESAQVGLFGADQIDAGRPRLAKAREWSATARLDEELAAVGFYLTGHPLEAEVEALRRKRVTLYADALPQALDGLDAFKMAGIVRRKQERTGRGGDRFAFVTLSDPTGEYEVLFPPEVLRRRRDLLEPGAALVIRVRAKAADGEVRFFGDEAEPLERAIEGAVEALRVHLHGQRDYLAGIKQRLGDARAERGGEVTLIAPLEGGRVVELRLPGRYALGGDLRADLKTAPGVTYLEDV